MTLAETIRDELSSSNFKKSNQHVTNYVFKRIWRIIFTPTRKWLGFFYHLSHTILRCNKMVLTSLFIVYTCIKRITRKLNIHVTCYMQYTCNNDWTCTMYCFMYVKCIYTKNRSLKTCTFKEVNVHLILLKSTILLTIQDEKDSTSGCTCVAFCGK